MQEYQIPDLVLGLLLELLQMQIDNLNSSLFVTGMIMLWYGMM